MSFYCPVLLNFGLDQITLNLHIINYQIYYSCEIPFHHLSDFAMGCDRSLTKIKLLNFPVISQNG